MNNTNTPKKVYKETGKRAEVIRQRTVTRSGYETEQALADAIKDMFEVQHMTFRMVSERTNLGRDAIRRLVSDYKITLPEVGSAIKTGCLDKLGTDNPMKSTDIKQRQHEGMLRHWTNRKAKV